MSYENALAATYSLGQHDFGAGAATYKVKPPPGFSSGRVRDIHVLVSETFTQTTTPAYIRVGDGTDDDKYAELNMGAAASGDSYNADDVAGSLKNKGIFNLSSDGITELTVKFVAPTGGTPAGIGEVSLLVEWF